MLTISPTRSAPAMRAATEGERDSRSRYTSCALPRRCLNTSALPTKPTLITPSGSGIIQNQPSAARWTVMKPGSSFSCICTPRQWAYTAAVELCLLDCFSPSLLAISVSRPDASRMNRGAYSTAAPSRSAATWPRPPPSGKRTAVTRVRCCVAAPCWRAWSNSRASNGARGTW